jgi:hypothetical protein
MVTLPDQAMGKVCLPTFQQGRPMRRKHWLRARNVFAMHS